MGSRSIILLGFNIINPRSTRPFTVTLKTTFSTGGVVYGIDSRTNSYKCNSGSLSSAQIILNSYQINALTTYTLTFTTANQLASGGYINIIFPGTITLGASCSSTNSSLSCSITNSTNSYVSVTSTIAANSVLRIIFISVKNSVQALISASIIINTYYDSL